MLTLFGARLQRHALRAGATPAFALPGHEVTYADLLDRVARCASWLAREGCVPSEVVGITIADELDHLVTSLALLSLGVPQVCLPTHDPVAMRGHLAERLSVRRVVATEPQHGLPGCDTLLLMPDALDKTNRDGIPDVPAADPDAPAIYVASSGTTGAPKIFALSQAALAWRAERMAESEGIDADRPSAYRALTPVSVESHPAKHKRLFCLWLGATSIFRPDDDSARATLPELCTSLGVTCLELSVLHASNALADRADARQLPTGTIVYTSGSRVPTTLREAFRSRFGVPLFVHYGAREFGRIATTYPGGHDDALETVGLPVPWVDLEIVDDDGRELVHIVEQPDVRDRFAQLAMEPRMTPPDRFSTEIREAVLRWPPIVKAAGIRTE